MTRNLAPADSTLVVVDIQERLFGVFAESTRERILRNTEILTRSAALLDVPLLLTEQYPRGLGPTVGEVRGWLPEGCVATEKTAFSCYGDEGFRSQFSEVGRRTVVLCGIETHVCILQTAYDLLDEDCRVIVAIDAVGSRTDANWQAGLAAMAAQGAELVPTETIVFQWLRVAGTPEFKAVSKLVK